MITQISNIVIQDTGRIPGREGDVKAIAEAETMRQLGARKGHLTKKRSKLLIAKFKKFLEKKEDTMDTELRELLDKANIVFFLGGNPELILWKIELRLEMA